MCNNFGNVIENYRRQNQGTQQYLNEKPIPDFQIIDYALKRSYSEAIDARSLNKCGSKAMTYGEIKPKLVDKMLVALREKGFDWTDRWFGVFNQ